MKVWSKTVLSIYRYLESLSKAIDNLIVKKSVNSMFYTNSRGNSTYDCASEIIELTQRKVNLINIKVMVDDGLHNLSFEHKRILMLCYVDGLSTKEMMRVMGCSARTFFRKKEESLVAFAKTLRAMGIDEAKLSSMFENEKWLKDLHDQNKQNQTASAPNRGTVQPNFLKKVMREIGKVNYSRGYGF